MATGKSLGMKGTLQQFILGFAAMFCAASASAESYVWQGEYSGTWAEPTNWSPNGTPGAGDTAVFSYSVEITDGFAIGSGTLTLNVEADVELSLKGVISGSGAIAKTGRGAISLYGANTFSGGFTAGETSGASTTMAYHGSTYAVNASGGLVGVWHGSGLGTGAVMVNTPLYVAGGITVTTPITKGWRSGMLIIRGEGDVAFDATFTTTANLPINGPSQDSTLRFKKPFVATVSGCWISHSGGYGINLVFEDEFAGDGSYPCSTSLANGNADFYGLTNGFSTLEIHKTTRFHQPNSFTASVLAFKKSDGWLDLCGCDQTLTNCTITQESGISDYGVSSDSPAQLKLTGQSKIGYEAVNPNFRGLFSGCAGLYFSRSGGYGIILDGSVQKTRGKFSFGGNAYLKLVNGASFKNLGELELLSSNGKIDLSNATSGDVYVDKVTFESAWTYFVGGVGKIYCRSLFAGSTQKEDGTYVKENGKFPALDETGEGGIVVNSHMWDPKGFIVSFM